MSTMIVANQDVDLELAGSAPSAAANAIVGPWCHRKKSAALLQISDAVIKLTKDGLQQPLSIDRALFMALSRMIGSDRWRQCLFCYAAAEHVRVVPPCIDQHCATTCFTAPRL
eukprot:scaffold53828_cov30-Prasinocladus_malaysianus.AAC.1